MQNHRVLTQLAMLLTAAALAGTAAAAPRTVLCLGDSLTEGYGVPKAAAYPALVDAALKAQGYKDVTVVNAGISGSTTASGVGRLKWHLKSAKPDVLLIELGANDGLRGAPLKTIEANLAATVEVAKARGVTRILLVGMQIPPNYGKDYAAGFARLFPAVAKAEGVELLPFLLQGVAGERPLNQADGIHPTEAGHQLVAKTVTAALVPLLGPP